MMKCTRKMRAFSIILVVILAIAFATFVHRYHLISRALNFFVYNNTDHYLSCEQLPFVEDVRKVVMNHRDVVEEILRSRPGGNITWYEDLQGFAMNDQIMVAWGEHENCFGTGKGDVVIEYPGSTDRMLIRRILGDSFFGIPYRLRNI